MIFATDIGQAFSNLRAQKTRTLLTALGIVFGVGSVIGMLAIGSGAREESLRFIEQLGVRNVLVDRGPPPASRNCSSAAVPRPASSDRDVRILTGQHRSAGNAVGPPRSASRRSVLPKPSHDIPELYGVRPSTRHPQPARGEGRFFDEADDEASAQSACSARAPR
jgi:putative ABC transport system permease protein